MFGPPSLNSQPSSMKLERSISTDKIFERENTLRRVFYGIPGEPISNPPQQPIGESSGTIFKKEEEVCKTCDVKPAERFLFEKRANADYELLK